MLLNVDLHIHSPYSMATSPSMTPEALLAAARTKGLDVIGSGDALHPAWRAAWQDHPEDGSRIMVVPTAEVEGQHRIHHLILAESFDQFADLAEVFAPHSRNLATAGRPHVALDGEGIASAVHEVGGLIGPAHAFTPWTSLYARFDTLAGCYGSEQVDFLELGLSADASYGAGIPDLAGVPFLSNSDAHSPKPVRLGREFTRLDARIAGVRGVLEAVAGGRITMNVGFFPEEGKYNRTACIECYRHYSCEEAEALDWRCPEDGKRIKKGVADRAAELTAHTPPGRRPPYLHIIPLGEIIARVLGTASPDTRRCDALYTELIAAFGDEITTLISAPASEIRAIHQGVGDAVEALRSGRITLYPGGGGRYGRFSFEKPARES